MPDHVHTRRRPRTASPRGSSPCEEGAGPAAAATNPTPGATLLQRARRLGHRVQDLPQAGTAPPQVQRLTMDHVGANDPKWVYQALFGARVTEGKATTGQHNYALNYDDMHVERSRSNGHAELKLLSLEAGDSDVVLVSEFKPCPDCQVDMRAFEQRHGVEIDVDYFIDYAARGDGDKDLVRSFYKALGYLEGGGIFVYSVVDGWDDLSDLEDDDMEEESD